MGTIVQWNPSLTICQGDVKTISLNRDIVIPGHIDFIVISGKILRSANKIPIVKPEISLNRRSLNWVSTVH